MTIRKIAAAAAALSLTAAPVMAQAATERTAAPVEEGSEMGGSALIIGILALAAIIAAIVIATDGSDDPVSP